MRRSKILLQIGIKEIPLWFFRLCLFPFLCTGTTLAFFHSWGNLPSFRQSLKNIERGFQVEFPQSFIIRIPSISWRCALFESKWLIILAMSLLEKFIESRHLFVSWGRSVGKTLLLLKREHWFTKKWLNNSVFSLKSVMNLFLWKRGGMQGIFLLFKNVFKIDQYVYGLVRGSANLLENLV